MKTSQLSSPCCTSKLTLRGIFAVGATSGGVFNPAVGTGPILVDALAGDGAFDQLWIYWAGPVLGGVAAAGVFDLQHAG